MSGRALVAGKFNLIIWRKCRSRRPRSRAGVAARGVTLLAQNSSRLLFIPGKVTAGSRSLMGRWSRIWLCCMSDGVPKRSLGVALIVGSILNLINQGDALVAGTRPNILKLILTFAVPYAVATYGAASYRLRLGSERDTETRH
jgi:hypothetical protein